MPNTAMAEVRGVWCLCVRVSNVVLTRHGRRHQCGRTLTARANASWPLWRRRTPSTIRSLATRWGWRRWLVAESGSLVSLPRRTRNAPRSRLRACRLASRPPPPRRSENHVVVWFVHGLMAYMWRSTVLRCSRNTCAAVQSRMSAVQCGRAHLDEPVDGHARNAVAHRKTLLQRLRVRLLADEHIDAAIERRRELRQRHISTAYAAPPKMTRLGPAQLNLWNANVSRHNHTHVASAGRSTSSTTATRSSPSKPVALMRVPNRGLLRAGSGT